MILIGCAVRRARTTARSIDAAMSTRLYSRDCNGLMISSGFFSLDGEIILAPISLPQNFFAALVQCVAATPLHTLEQCLHLPKLLHSFPELSHFSLGKLVPSFRWRCAGRETEKQLAYFLKREPGFSSALQHSQAKKHAVIVTALSIFSGWRRKNPDLLVVTNGGSAQTKHPRNIRNGEVFCHRES